MLRELNRGEPASAERGARTQNTQTFPSFLHANVTADHTHHVSLMRARGNPNSHTVEPRLKTCRGQPKARAFQPVGSGSISIVIGQVD